MLLNSKPVNTERQLHCRLTDVNSFRDAPIGIMFLHCSHCFSEKTKCFRLSIYRENDLFISLERRRTVLFREAEGELATTSLEFEYLHRKSRCEMWIGEDEISNDVITLGMCLHVFFNVCLHSRSFLLLADWRKSDSFVDGESQGNWRRNSNSRDVVANSSYFSRPAARAPRRACSQAMFSSMQCTRGVHVMPVYMLCLYILCSSLKYIVSY